MSSLPDLAGLLEHLRLKPEGRIPRRLAAHGCVEGENQPAVTAAGSRRQRPRLGKEGVDLA